MAAVSAKDMSKDAMQNLSHYFGVTFEHQIVYLLQVNGVNV